MPASCIDEAERLCGSTQREVAACTDCVMSNSAELIGAHCYKPFFDSESHPFAGDVAV